MGDDGGVDGVVPEMELADRIRLGDGDAEARLVAAYLPGIRVMVRRQCRPNDPALDDLVQDVLVRVLVHLRDGQVRDPIALPSYIRTLVANIVINEYRRRSQSERHDGSDTLDALRDPDNPENAADRAVRLDLVGRLLGELPVARDREILIRHYVNDEQPDHICSDMGIDQNLFRGVLHRARKRLRGMAERIGMRCN